MRPSFSSWFLAVLFLTLACGPAGCGPARDGRGAGQAARAPEAAPDSLRLTLMGTTDLHGRVYPYDYYERKPASGGLAAIATLVDSIRAADRYTLLVDSGDFLQGNPFAFYFARVDSGYAATGGLHPVTAAMNTLAYDASAIGNHEFNYGLPFLHRALKGAAFPFLAANIYRAGTDSLVHPPYVVKSVGPARVGLIGFTTPGVMVWDRRNVEGRIEVRDILTSADRWLPRLVAEAPDLIVATLHSGLGPGSTYSEELGVAIEDAVRPLAERHPEIDVVFFGHTHRDTPEERINGVLLTQAEKWGSRLAVAHVTLRRSPSEGRYRVTAKESRTLETATVAPSPRLLQLLEAAHSEVAAYVASPIARSTADWSAATARFEDTPIADLIQRVQLEATGADLSATSVFNPGAHLPRGELRFADVASLYVYDNTLKAVRITGRELREYLEASARYFRRVCTPERPVGDGNPCVAAGAPPSELVNPEIQGYNFDIVAGVDYSLDISRPAGERVVELTYDGRPVRDDQSFSLALNSYRQEGGGGFEMLAEAPVVYDRQEDVRQLLVDYVRARGTLRPEDVFHENWRLAPQSAVEPFLAQARQAAGPESARPTGGPAGSTEGSGCASDASTRAADSTVHLTFLATNDLHGALEGKVHPWSEGREVGGAAVLAGYIAEERAENPRGTVLLDGGDIMQGTPISNLVRGRSVIDFYNMMGYDAAAIGNHEFDWGIDTLEARMAQARFPLLSANIVRKADRRRPAWAVPTAIVERKGLEIGLVGLTTQSTPATTLPSNVAHLDFTDLARAVNEAVPALERAGVDLIVVVAHAGGYFDPDSNLYHGEIVKAMRAMTPAVDLVVSGHTHTLLKGEVNGISLVQARSSGTALGIVDVWVDARTHEVLCSETEVRTTFADAVRPVPEVAQLVERYRGQIGTVAERVVARAAHRLTADRRRESVLGDMIADAQRAAAGTQIALTNSGGIRTEIEAGPITWREVFEVQPFTNVLYRLAIDGRTLEAALENGVRGEHGLIQVSGLRFEVDSSAPGRRVRSITLEDGTPVHPDSTYTVAVNNFMAQGGDGYTMLRDAPAVTNTGLVDTDVFVDYLMRLPQPIRYEVQGRIRFLEEPARPGGQRNRGRTRRALLVVASVSTGGGHGD